jgi:glycosyltransferase involved in cell wall biosynthesis
MNESIGVKLPITVIIAVKNEERNLLKCLQSLNPAEKVIVIDSHSCDATADIARTYGAEFVQFKYNGEYPKKRQWALNNLKINSSWILLIDADEVVTRKLWDEIDKSIKSPNAADGYMIKKDFYFLGSRMNFGGFSFFVTLLFRNGKGRFEQLCNNFGTDMDMEVHERIIVDGKVEKLSCPLIHEDFKNLSEYIGRHNNYSTWEANLRYQYLATGYYGINCIQSRLFGNTQERRRWLKRLIMLLPFEHWIWFFYHYLLCLGILEGRRGLIVCQIRANYIKEVNAKIFELKNLYNKKNTKDKILKKDSL